MILRRNEGVYQVNQEGEFFRVTGPDAGFCGAAEVYLSGLAATGKFDPYLPNPEYTATWELSRRYGGIPEDIPTGYAAARIF